MAVWPLARYITYVNGTPVTPNDLNFNLQDAIVGLYTGGKSLSGLAVDGAGGVTSSPGAGNITVSNQVIAKQLIGNSTPSRDTSPLEQFNWTNLNGVGARNITDHLGYSGMGFINRFREDWIWAGSSALTKNFALSSSGTGSFASLGVQSNVASPVLLLQTGSSGSGTAQGVTSPFFNIQTPVIAAFEFTLGVTSNLIAGPVNFQFWDSVGSQGMGISSIPSGGAAGTYQLSSNTSTLSTGISVSGLDAIRIELCGSQSGYGQVIRCSINGSAYFSLPHTISSGTLLSIRCLAANTTGAATNLYALIGPIEGAWNRV